VQVKEAPRHGSLARFSVTRVRWPRFGAMKSSGRVLPSGAEQSTRVSPSCLEIPVSRQGLMLSLTRVAISNVLGDSSCRKSSCHTFLEIPAANWLARHKFPPCAPGVTYRQGIPAEGRATAANRWPAAWSREGIRRGAGRRCPGVGGMPGPGNAGPGKREALLSGRWPPPFRGGKVSVSSRSSSEESGRSGKTLLRFAIDRPPRSPLDPFSDQNRVLIFPPSK